MHSFGHKTRSFRDNLNRTFDQNICSTKVVQLYRKLRKFYQKLKCAFIYSQNTFTSSQSKQRFRSKQFFNKSCSAI